MKQQNKLLLIHPRRMTKTENSFTKKKSGNNISEMELKLYWATYKIDTTEKTLCVTTMCQRSSCVLSYKVPHKCHTL